MDNIRQLKAKVVRVDEEAHKFIVDVDDKLFKVMQFAFQRTEPMPAELDCVVSPGPRGGVVVTQDAQLLMSQRHQIGDEAIFTIKLSTMDAYLMEDEYGLPARMSRDAITSINAALTPKVKCRIMKFQPKGMEVKLVEVLGAVKSEFTLSEKEFSALLGVAACKTQRFCRLMLGDTRSDLFDLECHRWITELAEGKTIEEVQPMLLEIRERCLDTLQGKDLLPRCTEAERTLLEQRFTVVIEQLGYFIQAIDIVKEEKAREKIEGILSTLADSAYIFHAKEQFYIMQCIFLLDFKILEEFMPQILSTLRAHPQSLWMRKPFQWQWIKVLQKYVDRVYPQSDRLATDPTTKETMIQVLVLELLLGRQTSNMLYDSGLNQSLLYRLVSLMNVSEPNKTLQRAFISLFSETAFDALLPFNGDDAFIMANMLCSQDAGEMEESIEPQKYETESVLLSITGQAISVQPKNLNLDNLYLPFSSRQGLWHGLSVRLDEKPPVELRGKVGTTIEHYKRLWAYINRSLFSSKRSKKKSNLRKLDIDDDTDIIVVGQPQPDKLVFTCRIVEKGCEGTGTLDVLTDVVPYYPGEITLQTFEYMDHPLILRAYIKEVNPDGTYVFAMKEMIEDYAEDVRVNDLFFNTRLTCILNQPVPGVPRMPAISSEGLSVSVGVPSDMSIDMLHKGMIVEVDNVTEGPNGFLNATFVQESPQNRFSSSDAFHRLMLGYSNRDIYNPQQDKSEIVEAQAVGRERIVELMGIIDAKATLEEDNVKAYNYLNFCHVIAQILGSQDRMSYYDHRLQLLEILNDFALFDKVDSARIAEIANEDSELFDRNAMLRHDFLQLRIISCIDSDENVEALYRWSFNNEDPHLGQLASLVLSHNYVKKAGLLAQAGDILDKIRAMLKLRRSDSGKKNYGKEDFHTEFKTSLIYPENSMRENVEVQTVKIMQEICAFLNAEGGTLYLGVSDIGYELGLEEDLKNQLFKGSRDKYEVYVNNKIVYYLSQEGAHYVHTHFDDEVEKAVLIIDIKPCPTPMRVNGDYYERMGTSARRVNDNYREKFLANRQQWAEEHAPKVVVERPVEEEPAPVEETSATEQSITSSYEPAPLTDQIQTSRLRNNALHDYEEGYRPIVGVICLMGTDEYKVLDEDDWQDYRLKLGVHDDEEDGWLVLVYESGSVCKVSVSELLDRERGRVFKRYADEPLIFASIATAEDSVCVGFVDGKHNRYVRFDDIELFEQDKMQASGTLSMDVPNDGVHYVEIINRKKVPVLRNQGRKTIGCILKTVEGKRCMKVLPDCKAK